MHRTFRPNSTLELGEMVYNYYRGENEGDQDRLNMLSCGSEWVWVGGSGSNAESTLPSFRLHLLNEEEI